LGGTLVVERGILRIADAGVFPGAGLVAVDHPGAAFGRPAEEGAPPADFTGTPRRETGTTIRPQGWWWGRRGKPERLTGNRDGRGRRRQLNRGRCWHLCGHF
jgi:hypothetical protein